ncbi:MAG: Aminodeoxyfutalosine synthase [Phycisphaerae bacterium]|nr:Aminodeoxyfutalosine synthase [Phycisphaerae bacterium]
MSVVDTPTRSAFLDPALTRIDARLEAGQRLDQADGEALFATPDLHGLGRLANRVRRRRHGDVAYYNINRHINYTNVCVLRCKFCSFYRRPGAEGGYQFSLDQIVEQARQADAAGATEVHIVGGLHPDWRLDHYVEMMSRIRAACPRLHVKAFTAIEIVHFSRVSKTPVERVLTLLKEAGLGSLPGGGAEVFSERVHAEVFKNKVGTEHWLAVHEAAHRIGLRSTATMLYGHVETPGERVAHMLRLRHVQDRTGGFTAFIPLHFVPDGSELAHLPGPTALDDIRAIAVARLMLDNFDHVKTFWIMTGQKTSQLALLYGADDIDGTVVFYDITHRNGSGTHQEMTVERMHRLIRNAGLTPVERDTLYRRVIRDKGTWRVADIVA